MHCSVRGIVVNFKSRKREPFIYAALLLLFYIIYRKGTKNLREFIFDDTQLWHNNCNETATLLGNVNLPGLCEFESSFSCQSVLDGNASHAEAAKKWSFSRFSEEQILEGTENRCEDLKRNYAFMLNPQSPEEKAFPLAYGMLVYRNADQVMRLLSAVYQPQNQFCIAVDGKADFRFKALFKRIQRCFDNVQLFQAEPIQWCGDGITDAIYKCVKQLAASRTDWKYYQYLSGVDFPLKTNLEMVRIFKVLNGSFNTEILPYQSERLLLRWNSPPPHGLKLYKSSMSVAVSREAIDTIANSEKVPALLDYLNGTRCPDESFWATVAGNPKVLQVRGGVDAGSILDAMAKQDTLSRWNIIPGHAIEDPYDYPYNYYINWYRLWLKGECKAKVSHESCILGVDDLPVLNRRPELLAHKFYTEVEPAAFFCMWKRHRLKTMRGWNEKFPLHWYEGLAGVRLMRGEKVDEISWLPDYHRRLVF